MKNGDFSGLLALGSAYQIYNPFTRKADTATGRAGHYIEDAFVGNIIPANLINPVSKALLKYFPDPKTAGTTEFLNNNADSTLAEKTQPYDNMTLRIDHSFSDKHHIFGRASGYNRDSFYNDYFHNIATGTSF